MPLLIGSVSEADGLRTLVQPEYRDLRQYYRKQELDLVGAWLAKQPHLPRLTDDQLLVFLHCCHYSVERAKEAIDNYCTLRNHAPELFTKRNPKTDLGSVLADVYYSPLPGHHRTKEGHVLAFQRLKHGDSTHFSVTDAIKVNLMMMDMVTNESPLCEGLEVIMDMTHVSLGHVTKISLPVLKKFVMYVEEALPMRLKRIHIVNAIPVLDYIMALLTPIMKQEMLRKLHFHKASDFSKFTKKYIPMELLPSDYGGGQASLAKLHDDFVEKIYLACDSLVEMEKYKTEENKRCGRSRTMSDVYGMEGSFKKLDLD